MKGEEVEKPYRQLSSGGSEGRAEFLTGFPSSAPFQQAEATGASPLLLQRKSLPGPLQ